MFTCPVDMQGVRPCPDFSHRVYAFLHGILHPLAKHCWLFRPQVVDLIPVSDIFRMPGNKSFTPQCLIIGKLHYRLRFYVMCMDGMDLLLTGH